MKDFETIWKPYASRPEATLISALTTVPHKRELFAKHAEHLNALASEVERALAANRSGPISLCFIDANAIGSL